MLKTEPQIGPFKKPVKLCLRCRETKENSLFYKDKSRADGLQNSCIPCRKELKGITKREKERAKAREDRKKIDSITKEFNNHWQFINAEWRKSAHYISWYKAYRLDKNLQWVRDNPEAVKANQKRWREKHPEKAKKIRERWERENKEHRRDYKRKDNKRRRDANKSNPLEIAKNRIRRRTQKAFIHKRWQKRSPTRDMLGCSFAMLKEHIENQFTKGMTWKNREEWHIDHIIPLASAKSVEELESLSHFSNLRPMWAHENMAKGDKIIRCQPELLLKL